MGEGNLTNRAVKQKMKLQMGEVKICYFCNHPSFLFSAALLKLYLFSLLLLVAIMDY